jgi:hypothetical protein
LGDTSGVPLCIVNHSLVGDDNEDALSFGGDLTVERD